MSLTHFVILAIVLEVATVFAYMAFAAGYFARWWYNLGFILGAIADIACQVWIDITEMVKKKVRLDDHEEHIS